MKCEYGGCNDEASAACPRCSRQLCPLHINRHMCLPTEESDDEIEHEMDVDSGPLLDALDEAANLSGGEVEEDVLGHCGGSDDEEEDDEEEDDDLDEADDEEMLPVSLLLFYRGIPHENSYAAVELDLEAPFLCQFAHGFVSCKLTLTAPIDVIFDVKAFDWRSQRYGTGALLTARDARAVRAAAADDSLSGSVVFRVRYVDFYRDLAAYMIRDSADVYTLSRPDPNAMDITATFALTVAAKPVPDFNESSTILTNFPFKIGRPRKVDGILEVPVILDLGRCDQQHHDGVLAMCVAAEFTRRGDFVPNPLSNPCKVIWDENCRKVIQALVPIARGTAIFNDLVQRCLALKANGLNADFIGGVRDLIKACLITANDWDQPCEDQQTAPYHWSIAKTLGWIFRNLTDATADALDVTPMTFLREMSDVLGTKASVSLALQCGFGHCQEFATVTYVLLAKLMADDPEIAQFLGHIVHAAEIGGDHAFVVCGVTPQNPEEFGEDQIWELGAAIAAAGRASFICDAYLHPALVAVDAVVYFNSRFDEEVPQEEREQRLKLLDEFDRQSDFAADID